jgi:cytochrome c
MAVPWRRSRNRLLVVPQSKAYREQNISRKALENAAEATVIKLSILACIFAGLATAAAAGPLSDAVKAGDIDQVKLLIAHGEDVNQAEYPGGTPLHQAAFWGTAEMAELLIAEGAEVNTVSSVLGTPLKTAASKGNEAVAAVLIAHGADLEATGADATTPLHAAAEGGYASIVELLVENGADVNSRSTDTSLSFEHTPTYSAGRNGHFDIVDLLRAYGATGPTIEPVAELLASASSSEGKELFKHACSRCHSVEQGGSSSQGPNLWGVLGRKKASVEGFPYSLAFGRLVGTWTLPEFNAFIASPTDYIPGTNMYVGIARIRDPAQRADLIAYLREASDDPPPLPQRP